MTDRVIKCHNWERSRQNAHIHSLAWRVCWECHFLTEFLVHTYVEQGTSALFLCYHTCRRRQTLLDQLPRTFHMQVQVILRVVS